MTRTPSPYARLRAKARLEAEQGEGPERFEPSPTQKLEWLGSKTLRAPTGGHVDVVVLGRRKA